MTIRIIPRLDIKGPNLVKGVHLEGLRVLGRPERFAAIYYEQGADELLFMDVVASLYGRNSLLEVVERTARRMFIPMTVGGGLRTVDDIKAVLRAGADKVAINTAAITEPSLVRKAAKRFGSSSIVVSIEAVTQPDGTWQAFTENGREPSGLDAVAWARQAAELGAGEIMITSVDREGTGAGFDIELTRRVADAVPVPVVACGGAGEPGDVVDVALHGRADAIALGSILHYRVVAQLADDAVHRAVEGEGNTDYLRNARPLRGLEDASIPEVKHRLQAAGLGCRPAQEGVA